MIWVIIFLSLCIIVCLIGIIEDIFLKKDTGLFTFIGCLLGFWFSLILLEKNCEMVIKETKQEVPIKQVESTEQIVDTIPITLTIILQNE